MTENSSNKKAPAGKPGRALGITGYEPIIYKDYSNITPETIDPNLSEQEAAIKPQDAGPLSGALFTKLQPGQAAALDLYHRGINVSPLPPVWELLNYAAAHQTTPTKKPYPFIGEMYKYRLHVCGPDCERKARETGKRCMSEAVSFIRLFDRANIGAIMGRTSNNLFCIDCDDKNLFDNTRHELDKRGIKYWAYTGSKGGNILMRLSEGEAANKPGNKTTPEIWGNRHFVILPPSVHITGVFYQWITTEPNKLPPGEMPPLVTLEQVSYLGVELAKNKSGQQWQEPELYGLPAAAARLSWANRRFLGQGTYKNTRNNRIVSACRDLKGCDIPYETAKEWILAAAAKCEPPYNPQDTIKRLNWAYSKDDTTPAADYRATGKKITNDVLTRALEFANNHHWSGRTAQTDKAVFLACCKRAAIEGDTFRATSRETAELANTGRAAATRALQRLIGLTNNKNNTTPQLLRLAVPYQSDNKTGNVYAINDTFFKSVHVNTTNNNCSNSGINTHTPFNPVLPTTPAEQDIFGLPGIGRIAWQIWRRLLTEPQPNNKSMIARLLQLERTSVARAIDNLIKYGLIGYPAEGMLFGIPKTETQLQEIAARIDGDKTRQVFGRAEKRKREHELERAKRLHDLIYRQRKTWAKNYGLQQPAKKAKRGQP